MKKIKEIGARILWTLFFWGTATVLASSSYLGLVKVGGVLRENAAREMSGDVEPGSAAASGNAVGSEKGVAPGNAVGPGNGAVSGSAAAPENAGDSENARTAAVTATKYVALTFDDGPHPVYTPKLLDGLARRQVRATFFLIGKNIPGNEEIVEQMRREGHVIGNHTYDHVKICDLSGQEACQELEKTSALVREITGEDTEFVRPPFGAWNDEMECSLTMLPVLWDVDPLDWTTKNTARVVRRVLDDVESGDIILLHDCYDSSVEAALQIVDELQKQGYVFLTVDEMILE